MQPSDVPALMRLKEAANWNQIEQDWSNVMALEPEGCWVDEQQGQVAASTTAVCYGQELAWIGMVLVEPRFRGRGLARGLMEHALAWLAERGVRQVKLDATDMGQPLYAKLGFRAERAIERWGATRERRSASAESWLPPLEGQTAGPELSSAASCAAAPSLSTGPVAALDRQSFGVDRTRLIEQLLRAFPGQGASTGDGFALGRPGSHAYFLGPCAAPDTAAARCLLEALLARARSERFFWDLFPDVAGAADLARDLGFERRRELLRMRLHAETALPGRPERVFGAAGFEYG
ncbi:MAG TPA: GNAT family N-acetyltransferase [Bryobacterales bacterium]|nr:GNAT family N-acetyltransferase [Bryobacterales bacterium]